MTSFVGSKVYFREEGFGIIFILSLLIISIYNEEVFSPNENEILVLYIVKGDLLSIV